MSTRKRHGLVKFSRQFAAAVIVVTAAAFIGVGIEHSPASQAIAPHTTGDAKSQVVVRGGHSFVEIKTSNGELLHPLPAEFNGPGLHGGSAPRGGSGSPPDWQMWRNVVLIIMLITVVAVATAGLDQARRYSRRVGQSART